MYTFKEYYFLREGSRWRQPDELMAMQRRLGQPADVERGTALRNASRNIGQGNLPELGKRLDNLWWNNANYMSTFGQFMNDKQPSHIYRGHGDEDPYAGNKVPNYNGVMQRNQTGIHASPWAADAQGYGPPLSGGHGSTAKDDFITVGSQFTPTKNQKYYSNWNMANSKKDPNLDGIDPTSQDTSYSGDLERKSRGLQPLRPINKTTGYETEVEPEKHGAGIPALFKGGADSDDTMVANPTRHDMNKIYRPLTRKLSTLPRRRT